MGDTYNIAVIGAGNIGTRYIEKSLLLRREGLPIENIFFSRQSSEGISQTRSRLEEILKNISTGEREHIKGFNEYQKMLENAKKPLKSKLIIVISTPPEYHYRNINKSFRSQPHAILCEKPLCNIEDVTKPENLEKKIDRIKKFNNNRVPIYVNQQIMLMDCYFENNNPAYKEDKNNCETASATWICPNKPNHKGGFSVEECVTNLVPHPLSPFKDYKLSKITELSVNNQNQILCLKSEVEPIDNMQNSALKNLNLTAGYGPKQCKIEFHNGEINHVFEYQTGINPVTNEFSQKFDYYQTNQGELLLPKKELWLPEDLIKMTLRKIITGDTEGLADLNSARQTMMNIVFILNAEFHYRNQELRNLVNAG